MILLVVGGIEGWFSNLASVIRYYHANVCITGTAHAVLLLTFSVIINPEIFLL
jgi:hypothetical protein